VEDGDKTVVVEEATGPPGGTGMMIVQLPL
jgi:hypothetical protein